MEKIILGQVEEVKINGFILKAKIDTGADRNSICNSLVNKLKMESTGKKAIIKSSNGTIRREIYAGTLQIKGRKFDTIFTVADRRHLKYDALIGKNILKQGFLIDPSK